MSRLYIKHDTDMGRDKAHRGKERVDVTITWGHRDYPQNAITASVVWRKDEPAPTVVYRIGTDDVKEVALPLP